MSISSTSSSSSNFFARPHAWIWENTAERGFRAVKSIASWVRPGVCMAVKATAVTQAGPVLGSAICASLLLQKKRALESAPCRHDCTGFVGDREDALSDRFTFINGIMNTRESAVGAAEAISAFNGGARVHYVADPTLGVVDDLEQCVVLDTLGAKTEAARRLAKLWKRQLKEMDQAGSTGRIIHYAHSRGGMVTKQAIGMLTAEERSRIVFHIIGSPAVVYPEECEHVTHHISTSDGVPRSSGSACAYPLIKAGRSLCGKKSPHIRVYPTRARSCILRCGGDHALLGDTYRETLAGLGTRKTMN